MSKYQRGVVILITALIVIFGFSLIPWRSMGQEQKPIRVITSLNFYGEVAKDVAGRYGQVDSLINSASVDPHDYQPGTKQAQKMEQANVVIQNGLGYDHWLTELANSTSDHRYITIDVGRQVAGKHAGDNEHVWYAPSTMGRLATRLANKYGQLDPTHRGYYRQRARNYRISLRSLNHEIAVVKKQVGPNKDVAVSEPVFDYALHALGYHVIDPHFEKAIEDGNDPSPQDIKDLQQAIIKHHIAFFVENKQTNDKVISNLVRLARQHHVPVLQVTESKPTGLTYQEWMLKQYRQLAKIQRKEE
ncbi:metal ABC transporter solute-binding protein, Zn/Mn family [Limosilactobacillus sp.]|uniref:metal ABC transporter solute-binding protein, Zn/Mn family n=1 Tax=Limosilactobacillus sp. TaxID=2773925 RepID=UPI00359F199C